MTLVRQWTSQLSLTWAVEILKLGCSHPLARDISTFTDDASRFICLGCYVHWCGVERDGVQISKLR